MKRRNLSGILPAPRLVLLALAAMLMMERPAAAYTDPGSSMFLIQLLTSAVLGLGFYYRRILQWFDKKFRKGDSIPPTP
jgi:hypothetical protein